MEIQNLLLRCDCNSKISLFYIKYNARLRYATEVRSGNRWILHNQTCEMPWWLFSFFPFSQPVEICSCAIGVMLEWGLETGLLGFRVRGGGESFDSGTVAVFLAAALTDFHDFFHHLIFRVAVINSTVVHRFQKGRQLFWRLIGETRIWCLLHQIGLVRGECEWETCTSLHLV